MKILLTVVIGVIIWAVLIACTKDTLKLSPEIIYPSSTSEDIDEIPNPNLIAQEVTVKIKISTDDREYTSSGVIVGDGCFVVTYAPEISASLTRVEVTHISSKVVTAGSVIYFDEIFGLALIRLTDDLGTSVVVSQSFPRIGERLIISDFLPIGGEDLTVTRDSTVEGFELNGLIMKFGSTGGSGNAGGPVLNEKGQLVGVVTHWLSNGESGSVMSPETFKHGLAEELVKYNESVGDNVSNYDLSLIGIPAHVTKPSGWNIFSGIGYFDIRAPELSDSREGPSDNRYKVIGIINSDSSAEETSEEVLNRAIAEFGDAFKRVPEFVIPDQHGLDKCVLLMTVEEYSRTGFERRGYVIPGAWVSHPGIYIGLCTGIGKDQRVLVFAESHDVDDIVNADGLFEKIALVQ